MICKECFEKKYGRFSELFYYLDENIGICCVCGKKGCLVKKKQENSQDSYLVFL